jgi:hypothetical protein
LLDAQRMACVPSACAFAAAAFLVARAAAAQPPEQAPAQPSDTELARQIENPVSKLTSIPVRYQDDFGIGPAGLARNTVSFRPTIALPVASEMFLVSRTTVPLVSQPDVARGTGTTSGLGDVAESLFFVPPPASGVILGVGPTVLLPTASPSELGSGQAAAGPTAAVVVQPRGLTLGVLAAQLWSVARTADRPYMSRLSVMYVVGFHFPGGWYVKTAPVISANWSADSPRNTWTIPVGGGVGKVLHLGEVPLNVSVAAYWNAIRPDTVTAPSGNAQVQVALLLPK